MGHIQLGHGSGGKMMHQLIKEKISPAFDLKILHDSAVLDCNLYGRVAMTTDSYVISPYFFPGGDIGMLSVYGTVNDLAMSGARPLYLTASFILEEGFPVNDLEKILFSMKMAAEKVEVQIVTGDTKVVERGKGDGIFINTAGIGLIEDGIEISPCNIRPGDKVILSDSIGKHGIAVMAERNGITFDPPLLSDVRPLNFLVRRMLSVSKDIKVMRDPTRGGLATTLKEFADESGYCIMVDESLIKVEPGVRGVCELLGLDPLYVANEGVLVAIAPADVASIIVDEMKEMEEGVNAMVIGDVTELPKQTVLLKTIYGGIRIIDMLPGAQFPRIC